MRFMKTTTAGSLICLLTAAGAFCAIGCQQPGSVFYKPQTSKSLVMAQDDVRLASTATPSTGPALADTTPASSDASVEPRLATTPANGERDESDAEIATTRPTARRPYSMPSLPKRFFLSSVVSMQLGALDMVGRESSEARISSMGIESALSPAGTVGLGAAPVTADPLSPFPLLSGPLAALTPILERNLFTPQLNPLAEGCQRLRDAGFPHDLCPR